MRAIIASDTTIKTPGGEIAFKIKPGKIHVFDADTGKVLH
jgi:multiple sugar transport system ATP-binding protein